MEDYVKITTPIEDYQVLQHETGSRRLLLEGSYKERSYKDKVVVRVLIERTNAVHLVDYPVMREGKWSLELDLAAGEIYRVETGLLLEENGFDERYLGRGEIVRHLGVGEVFLLAGQSNAVGYAREIVDDPPLYGVSMYDRRRCWSLASHPIGHVDADKENASMLMSGHSPWLALGKRIFRQHGLPVGLVPLALNGSFLEQWMPPAKLYKALKSFLPKAGHLVFYQGCSNVSNGRHTYGMKLEALMRRLLESSSSLRIYLLQISGTKFKWASQEGWKVIREAQRRVAVQYNFPLISTYDLTDYTDDIHIGATDNLRIAERVYAAYANHALTTVLRAERHDDATVKLNLSQQTRLKIPTGSPIIVLDGDGRSLPVETLYQDGGSLYVRHRPGEAWYVSTNVDSLSTKEPITDHHQALPFFHLSIEPKTV